MTKPKDLILDPFAGTGSIGVAAAIHGRRFWGCEISAKYAIAAQGRINQALRGEAMWRPHNKPIKSV
jgi:adenine-specific DNA-methyltransferase